MIKYKNPPIVEAVFSVSFKELISIELIEKFRNSDYIMTNYPINHEGVSIQVDAKVDLSDVKSSLIKEGYLFRSDRNKLLNLKFSHLSFHSINKYNGWENESDEFYKAIKEIQLLGTDLSINNISCRFINKIELPIDANVDISKYLNAYPQLPSQINNLNSFFLSYNTLEQKSNIYGTVNIKLEFFKHNSEDLRLIVDTIVNKSVDNLEIISKFEELRTYKNLLFENLLTSETKKIFDL